jgi:hypothetical protein
VTATGYTPAAGGAGVLPRPGTLARPGYLSGAECPALRASTAPPASGGHILICMQHALRRTSLTCNASKMILDRSPLAVRFAGHRCAPSAAVQGPAGPGAPASRPAGNGQVPAERAGLAAPACHYRGKELQMKNDRRIQGRHPGQGEQAARGSAVHAAVSRSLSWRVQQRTGPPWSLTWPPSGASV